MSGSSSRPVASASTSSPWPASWRPRGRGRGTHHRAPAPRALARLRRGAARGHFAPLARLQGDFFCAPSPVARTDRPCTAGPRTASGTSALRRRHPPRRPGPARMGATVLKELRVEDDSPFVYQRHLSWAARAASGRQPRQPVAPHGRPHPHLAQARLGNARHGAGDRSRPRPLRAPLPRPVRGPRAFPGSTAPLTCPAIPWNPRHEDFVMGLEAPGHRLGWTAVTRPGQGDLYLSLRDARRLPMTMLWHSNGGRDYPPGRAGISTAWASRRAQRPHAGPVHRADLAGSGTLALSRDRIAESAT
jgi:hypothetical protein